LAEITIKASDLTGKRGEVDEFGRLVVHDYPGIASAKQLDVLPDEVKDLKGTSDVVEVTYYPPGSKDGQRIIVARNELDQLHDNMAELLQNAKATRGRPRSNGA
jgi:hypothetical protein